jgi:eukaryotic-like serine/threonine-protein kinase
VFEGGLGRFVGDRYHIIRELGRGGMGVVYLGRDLRRDMDVAIKFRGITHHDATLWLKREFRAVASLRHPNLVELYELVAHEQSCYFTMEYLPGVDPREWVARPETAAIQTVDLSGRTTNSAVPVQEARTELSVTPAPAVAPRTVPDVDFARVRQVLAQLAEGIAYLHAHGVIHRDVKPSNVLVVDDTVKLLDFGLALERRRAEEELARETKLVGTAAYLAPEYVEKLTVSPAMDVYALGVVAFELVTGAPPFGGALHVLSRLNRKMALPRASSLNGKLPDDLDELIEAMLAADPLRRPTAIQIATRLTGELSHPRPVRGITRFVGREAELERITARVTDPRPQGRLVLVSGPSGVGKTALIEEALGRMRDGETIAWRGRCHERERVPYRAFDFIIDDFATELAGNARVASQLEHAGALARVFPTLGAVLDPMIGEVAAAGDLRVERERALLAMTQLFRHVLDSAVRGIVEIDDLQWADEDSLELLALLVERVGKPLTIVASWAGDRERIAGVLERLGSAAEIVEVAPMQPQELIEVLADVAPEAPTERLQAAARLAAGSPYLAELIGRELADAGLADPTDAETRRLDRLTEPERRVAEITALSAGSATFEQLRAIADLPSAPLQSVLRFLEEGRIVRSTPSASGDPVYVFYHQRLRDAAQAAMSPDARKGVHHAFASWFEREGGSPDQLAYHWQHAGEPARAARAAIAAADVARAQLAWGLAGDWYGKALELGGNDPAVRAARAECLFLGGKLAAAAAEFEVLASAERDGDRWRVRAAESYIKLGEVARSLGILDGVLARHGEPRARGRATSALRAVSVAARWIVPAQLRRPPAADDVLAAAYRVIASFLSTPYPIEAFEYVLRGIDRAERTGDVAAHAMGMAMLAAYLASGSLGRFGDRAIATAQRLSLQSGEPYPRMVTAGATGIVATLRGNWTGMRLAHEEGERICKKLGLERSWEASFLRAYWALGELYAGEPTRALAMLGEVESDDLITRGMLGSYRGRALVLDGNLVAARALARELAKAKRGGLATIYHQVFEGELALAEHDWARAHAIGSALARQARAQWLSAMPAVSAMIDVLLATAEIGLGDRASAEAARTRARALVRRAKSSFYAATALRLWAQAEARLGLPTEALLARAGRVASERGGKVDRLAIAALAGDGSDAGPLRSALVWSTGGVLD